jgi:hypothetical protein
MLDYKVLEMIALPNFLAWAQLLKTRSIMQTHASIKISFFFSIDILSIREGGKEREQ